MQRTVRVINEFTHAGTNYQRDDVFRHDVHDVELGGLIRAGLVKIEQPAPVVEVVGVSPSEHISVRTPEQRKQSRARAQE